MALGSRVEEVNYRSYLHSKDSMSVSANSPFQVSSTSRYRRSQSAASAFNWRPSTMCTSSPESVEEDMELDSFDDSVSNLWSHSQRITEIDTFNLDLTRTNTSRDNGLEESCLAKSLNHVLVRSQSSISIITHAVAEQDEQHNMSSKFNSSHHNCSDEITNEDEKLHEMLMKKPMENKKIILRQQCLLFFVLLSITVAVFFHIAFKFVKPPCVEQINMPLLHHNMVEKVFGQHIAVETVVKVISEFNEDNSRQHLVMIWHGWTGVGKNYMSNIVSEHLSEAAVHKMIVPLHFAHGTVKEASDLRNWILSNVTSHSACQLQLFIIDEVDKASNLVIESLHETLVTLSRPSPLLSSRAIIILLSNDGAININLQLSQLLLNGKPREEVKRDDLPPIFHSTWLTKMVQDGIIEYVVPFLPLEKHHVIQCIEAEVRVRQMKPSPELIEDILSRLSFFPSDLKFFVKTGCRKISYLVDLVL